MISCYEREPAPYKQRLHETAMSFCIKLNNCTTASYAVCMQSVENKVKNEPFHSEEEAEMELEKLKQFTQTSTCNDIWLMVYSYNGGK